MSAKTGFNLATDAMLPQRDLLLDVDQVRRRFSARLGTEGAIEIDRCERLRVKYSPGASLRVLHRVEVGGASYIVAARAFIGGRGKSAFGRAASKVISCGHLLPVAHDEELDTVYWTFPNDRKITNLSALASPPEALANLLERRWTRSRIVAYAPEKCVTAECLGNKNELLAYAKIYADDETGSYDIYNALSKNISAAKSDLRIARALAYSEEHRALLLEPVAGRRLADLGDKERVNGFRRFGAALAALHGLPLSDDLPPFTRLDRNRLQDAARVIARARPDLAMLAENLARELCKRRDGLADQSVCLHGDVHPKNGILQNDRMALIDLDQAGMGPAAADLGSLLAALRYLRCVGNITHATGRELAAAFLCGYGDARRLPEENSLRWHTAAALLAERSLRAVNRIRGEGLRHLKELLLDSRRLLTEDGYEN
ncbi:MAG TPA: aminoglycoside phosphotransferase family protein [Blastocatellia bacterium]|nr:aminoglycoside phosphotransferase family protein [Blastocatellia bacterium]